MYELATPTKLTRLVKDTIDNTEATIRIQKQLTFTTTFEYGKVPNKNMNWPQPSSL